MVDACVALAADRDNNLAAPRMEWIKDQHFNRQTPGIMTLDATLRSEAMVRSAYSERVVFGSFSAILPNPIAGAVHMTDA